MRFKHPFARIVVAALGGLLLAQGFAGDSWWLLVPLGLAALLWPLSDVPLWQGAIIGFVGGATFWLSLIDWLTLYLGPLPWVALAGIMTLYNALAAAVIALIWRLPSPKRMGRVYQLGVVPISIATVWALREWLASTWPYGGFSWGRVPMAVIHSPLEGAYSWIGATGVSVVVVWTIALLIQLLRVRDRGTGALLILVTLVLAVIPPWQGTPVGSMRVLAIQGGVDASLFSDALPGSVLQAHATETLRHRGTPVGLVIWPENAADVDPLRSESSQRVVSGVVEAMGAPLLLGTITVREHKWYNTSVLWTQDGPTQFYDKMHPVPFAEYVPDRQIWRPFAPDLIDLIQRDYQIGSQPNVIVMDGVKFGASICFDIADDSLIDQMMHGGASVVFAQTNNADFGRTDQSRQQFDIARMRALETGRTVVNVSTVGVSGVAFPTGLTEHVLPTWDQDSFVADVNLVAGQPPSTVLGKIMLVACSVVLALTLALPLGKLLRTRFRRASI